MNRKESTQGMFPLSEIGYNDRYYLSREGYVYDTKRERRQTCHKYSYNLLTKDGKLSNVSLKALYRRCFNEEYCIDTIENLPGEQWKAIEGFPCHYISSCGRIKSKTRYHAILLCTRIKDNGYEEITLCGKHLYVHRLVALAFIPNDDPENKTTVDHIDFNVANNHVSNLRWMNDTENKKRRKPKGGKKRERSESEDYHN